MLDFFLKRRLPQRGLPLLIAFVSPSCQGADSELGPERTTSDEANSTDSSASGPDSPAANDDAGVTPVGDSCEVPQFEESPEAVAFAGLSATVVDEQGSPVSDVLAQACGLNVCLQQPTDSQGRVAITGEESITKVAFKYGDGLRYAQLALLLDGSGTHELGQQYTLALPALNGSTPLRAGEAATSSDASLTVSQEAVIKFDLLSFPDESEHVFVAREFDLDTLPEAVERQQFAAVWAFGPLKTEFCPPAELSLPNTAGFEPATRLDLLLHVTDIAGHWARYGEWGKVARATVSEDGQYIVTDPGHGLPELGVVGLQLSAEASDR